MASVNSPLLSNAIRNDVPAINAIIKALAKADPSILSDLESGTKRFYEGTNGWEFQELVNGSWVTHTKFNIDAQSVDGYNTSVDAVASTIVVRDTNGKLKGNLTGKADTAGTADKLASTLAVTAGGTGATTAAAARTNLGVPPTNHASTASTYGVSSGTEYGHPKASTTTPKALGTAAVGAEESSFARGDHVHPITKGNASTFGAVKLSDSTSSTSAASANIAATPKAVKAAYDRATTAINAIPSQTDNAGSSLITDGTSTLWHPVAQDILDAAEAASADSDAEISGTTADSIMSSITTLESGVGALQNSVGRASAYIIESWVSGTSWYRKYSDGWIEQGGHTGEIFSTDTVSLTTAFSATDYTLVAQNGGKRDTVLTPTYISLYARTTTSFRVGMNQNGMLLNWYACGY